MLFNFWAIWFFRSELSAQWACMKNYFVNFDCCFSPPHSRSRDGISPAVLPVWHAAVSLNPHVRQTPNQNSKRCLFTRITLYRTSRDCPLLLLPQWFAALSFFPPPIFLLSRSFMQSLPLYPCALFLPSCSLAEKTMKRMNWWQQ